MSKNRRRHPRVRARGVAAHLRTEQGRAAAQVENISMGGIFVRTDRLQEVGTEIFVDLVKPGWKRQLTLHARITSRVDAVDGRLSRRMPGLGMQFLRLDDKQHDRLQSLLRELGAPEEDLQVTLPDESAEPELRALDFEASPADAEPLDPQPQPLWQQAEMVRDERRTLPPRGLVEAIEGTLREANLPPPGPLVLEPEPRPSRPDPQDQQPHELERGSAPGDEPVRAPAAADSARLMLQIRGLVMQLAEAQQQLRQRDQELERLRDEVDTLRGALERSVRKA